MSQGSAIVERVRCSTAELNRRCIKAVCLMWLMLTALSDLHCFWTITLFYFSFGRYVHTVTEFVLCELWLGGNLWLDKLDLAPKIQWWFDSTALCLIQNWCHSLVHGSCLALIKTLPSCVCQPNKLTSGRFSSTKSLLPLVVSSLKAPQLLPRVSSDTRPVSLCPSVGRGWHQFGLCGYSRGG